MNHIKNSYIKFMNKYWKRVLVICFCMVFCIVCICKVDGIYKLIKKIETSVSKEMEYQTMHKENVQIDQWMPLTDEENAWYTKYHFISHAGGG